ncbi:hypothetical protein thsps117_36140 [Pseudomonas sp. No.117]
MTPGMPNLDPLRLPPEAPFWPPAPGWWLLVLVVVALAFFLRHRHGRRPLLSATVAEQSPEEDLRTTALAELERLPRPYGAPAGPWLQALNALLKRLCRASYPDQISQTLSGRDWLAFLDSRCPAAGLTRYMILVDGGYRPDLRLEDRIIDGLQDAVATWIRKHV